MNYAVEIVDGIVAQVIVGNAEWATNHLGGQWVNSDHKVGIGWIWDGQQFRAPDTEVEL